MIATSPLEDALFLHLGEGSVEGLDGGVDVRRLMAGGYQPAAEAHQVDAVIEAAPLEGQGYVQARARRRSAVTRML